MVRDGKRTWFADRRNGQVIPLSLTQVWQMFVSEHVAAAPGQSASSTHWTQTLDAKLHTEFGAEQSASSEHSTQTALEP
jgi:hypothetical protein